MNLLIEISGLFRCQYFGAKEKPHTFAGWGLNLKTFPSWG